MRSGNGRSRFAEREVIKRRRLGGGVRGLRRRPRINKALWLFRNIFQARTEGRCHGVTSRVVRCSKGVPDVVCFFHHGSQWSACAIRAQRWELIPHTRLSTRVRGEGGRLLLSIFCRVANRVERLTRRYSRRRVCRLGVAMSSRTDAGS
jgi:hypothetical protein